PAGRRALKNQALAHLMAAEINDAQTLAQDQFAQADNMTDRLAALSALVNHGHPDVAAEALATFYAGWQDDPLVVDKWFALQATAISTDVAAVRALMAHPAFTLRNPNRARALVFQFCLNNARGMHRPDGDGYAYWAEQVLALDALNPEIAARLARALDNWSRFVPALRTPMQQALQTVRSQPGLSRNVVEIGSNALDLAACVPGPSSLPTATAPETQNPYSILGRAAALGRCAGPRSTPADRNRGPRLQGDQPRRQQRRAGRRAGQPGLRKRPGRSPEKTGRPVQRNLARGQRMGRPPGRDGVRRNGNPPSDPQPASQGRVSAAVRSPGRLVEHRRQRVDRHDFLGIARPSPCVRGRSLRTGFPAARQPAGCGRLRGVRAADH